MNCPACQSVLRKKRYHEIVLDSCPECRGIWFDQIELAGFIHVFLERHPDLPNATAARRSAIASAEAQSEHERLCPRCRGPLRKVNYGYDSNIIVDKCGSCDGVWVDRSEVKPLAVYTKGNPKLDKLGASLAQHVTERHEQQDMVEGLEGLARSSPLWFYMPRIIVPLGDDAERRTVPVVTMAIILANVAATIWALSSPLELSAIFSALSFVPKRILVGESLFTVLTAMVLHAGLFHLLGNCLFLWVFGDNVEDAFGHFLFTGFYIACGVCAFLAFLLSHMGSEVGCVGASGAISGVMGAYFVLYPKARVKTLVMVRVLSIPAYVYLGIWFLFQLLFASSYGEYEPVAFSAHAGGFAAGILLALCHRVIRKQKP
jgi:membrane associated rhomboid family serine protease/Zn-finger nucleic acid-binding protein